MAENLIQAKRDEAADWAELRTLVALANKGQEVPVGRIQAIFSGPMAKRFVETLGNVVSQAQAALVNRMVGDNKLLSEAILRKASNLWTELAGDNPSTIEKLLVERVVLCWLQIGEVDLREANSQNSTLAQADHTAQRQERAQRRFLAAVKMLATVRRMALPIKLDVNLSADVQTRITGIPSHERSHAPAIPRFSLDGSN